MNKSKSGFTLTELLIALALLGIIAAFTIPKVFQAQGNREAVAKVRETVSIMENVYYGMRDGNTITQWSDPWKDWVGTTPRAMNVLRASTSDVDAVDLQGASPTNAPPLDLAVRADGSTTHPCGAGANHISTATVKNGWAQFPNGVVITGLGSSSATANDGNGGGNIYGAGNGSIANMYVFCIDINGPTAPNEPGQDVYFTNFIHMNSGAAFYHNGAGNVFGSGTINTIVDSSGTDVTDKGKQIQYYPNGSGANVMGTVAQLLTNR